MHAASASILHARFPQACLLQSAFLFAKELQGQPRSEAHQQGAPEGQEQANALAVPVWVAWDPKGEEAEA